MDSSEAISFCFASGILHCFADFLIKNSSSCEILLWEIIFLLKCGNFSPALDSADKLENEIKSDF
jgi:hypothetical protein